MIPELMRVENCKKSRSSEPFNTIIKEQKQ
nr:hypothetical protein [Sicyoidochytrium minutum DNA virus]